MGSCRAAAEAPTTAGEFTTQNMAAARTRQAAAIHHFFSMKNILTSARRFHMGRSTPLCSDGLSYAWGEENMTKFSPPP